jgi:peptidoglycan/xylan/chitin deacetylase (PgdA/CDA1 family)
MFDLTLSFDNGPDPDVTPAVLDILAARGIAATFFAIGRRLAAPGGLALAERAWREGHWIGNHTWNHAVPLGACDEPDLVERELARTQHLLAPFSHDQRWFRPFGGGGNLDRHLLNPEVVAYLTAERFSCVLWNAVPRDWADPDGWVETALVQCAAQDWTLLVLHDLPTGAMRHLPRFLDAVRARGGRFRQDFPPACVPIQAGRIVADIAPYVAPAAARDAA